MEIEIFFYSWLGYITFSWVIYKREIKRKSCSIYLCPMALVHGLLRRLHNDKKFRLKSFIPITSILTALPASLSIKLTWKSHKQPKKLGPTVHRACHQNSQPRG